MGQGASCGTTALAPFLYTARPTNASRRLHPWPSGLRTPRPPRFSTQLRVRYMERYLFAVGDEPFCLWGYDLARENDVFLRSFDSSYFEYVARLHLNHLEGEDAPRAAIALRAAYHHGLEALFSLLGALSQAPAAVTAWIPRCSNSRLRRVVSDISANRPILTQRGPQPLSWQVLAEIVHSHVWVDEEPRWATATRYARLWSRFAHEFLDDLHIAEYNSIKHGFRVLSGGSVLRVGVEPSYGVSSPESEMQTIGASPHGVNFSTVEPIPATEPRSPHVRLMHQRPNWRGVYGSGATSDIVLGEQHCWIPARTQRCSRRHHLLSSARGSGGL